MTTAEVEHRGITFPENAVVLVSAWHANRDGTQNADEYDITAQRDGLRLLTFGAGIHYCVGANLARAELQEGLVLLAETVEEIQLDGEPQYGTPSGDLRPRQPAAPPRALAARAAARRAPSRPRRLRAGGARRVPRLPD